MRIFNEIEDRLPCLRAVVQISPPRSQLKIHECCLWSDLESINCVDVEDEYQQRLSRIDVNDCCLYIYTSGTVGMPKCVMISHDNLIFNALGIQEHIGLQNGNEKFVSFLPMSHAAGQIFDMAIPLVAAGTVYFADKDALKGSILNTLVDVQPTAFLGFPRIFEKMIEKMMTVADRSGYTKKAILSWAQRVALKHHENRMAGRSQVFFSQYGLARKFVQNEIKSALGLRNCRNIISGAAPISVSTKKHFLSFVRVDKRTLPFQRARYKPRDYGKIVSGYSHEDH